MFKRFGFSKEKRVKEKQYELLNRLREMLKFAEGPYIEETHELLKPLQMEMANCINVLIEDGFDKEGVIDQATLLLAKGKEMQGRIDEAIEMWEKLKVEILEVVEFGVAFIQQSNFYPPEYTFTINKLKGSTIEIDEHIQNNPFHEFASYHDLILQVQTEIKEFRVLHEETVALIDKIKKRKIRFNKEEKSEMLEIKEKLFRNLQMGQLDEVRKELKKLRKELKRI